MRTTPLRASAALGSVAVLVALAGCSTSPATAEATDGTTLIGGSTEYPLTVDNCGFEQTFETAPSRVVLLNGASVAEVESLLLLGLGDTVLANTQNYGMSDQPELVEQIDALPTGDLEMAGSFEIPAEQLLALKPDLVIATTSGGFDPDSGQSSRDELAAAGIKTIVNPANCAMGKEDATAAEQDAFDNATVESSFGLLNLIGNVFDRQDEADSLVTDLRAQIDAVSAAVEGREKPNGLIVFPGMSMMTPNGMPAVFLGGIFDDVLTRAGVGGALDGGGLDFTSSIDAEQLAAADVDILVVGGFMRDEDLDAEAAALFAEYPQWDAAKNNKYVTVSDGVYVGPTNAAAVTKIAQAAHPDAF
ncbi:ABC transporter iron(III)/siderophore-binding protein [Pseudoclavibacter sp. RFBG4]|uniref:ABC transporter substrate-binding protein n=1 Tax=Pseudoclavibacter sp. RFBG4 TaxID=2080575 RepID=UPI000CE7F469|nr:ABC transporter substrate-binding protein [Pseudoclavibacter sp. RFBG4]PPG28601.1 ABC transporter iron(III)/siderophore-binding protein [Pseudoclavibacter sp. RFBG4]